MQNALEAGECMDACKKAVILGASSGIGKEMAVLFADNGWKVAITGRRTELLEDIARTRSERILPETLDVDDVASLPGRLDALAARLGGIDLLVVSAGCGFLNEELSFEPELRTVATNVTAFTVAAAWAYAYFKNQGHGHLAAITSVGGLVGEGAAPAYSSSKAYQILYLDSLAKRAKKEKSGCVVTELRPGFVDTDMMKGGGGFWVCSPEAAAKLAYDAIRAKKRLQYITKRWFLIGLAVRLASLFG